MAVTVIMWRPPAPRNPGLNPNKPLALFQVARSAQFFFDVAQLSLLLVSAIRSSGARSLASGYITSLKTYPSKSRNDSILRFRGGGHTTQFDRTFSTKKGRNGVSL